MKKSTTILAGLFILLLAVFYLGSLKEKKQERGVVGPVLEVEKDRITQVEITKDQAKIVLAKQKGEWQISDPLKYRANQAYVEDLLGNILSLEIDALASELPEKQTFYGVDTGGIIVKVSAEDRPLSSFIIGKQSYPHTYLRPLNSTQIYRVKGVSRWYYTRQISDWRDKTIFDFDTASVKEITLSETEAVIRLLREGDLWKMESKGEESPADTEAVNQLLSTASTLKANDFKDTAPERDFSRPDFRVAITFDSGETRGLSLLAEDESQTQYLAQKRMAIRPSFCFTKRLCQP
ncbi:MAG: DUF4340 domain-containing protein [bacterium]